MSNNILSTAALKSLFEATHIHRLYGAARAAGMKFRNNDFNKAAVIDALVAEMSDGSSYAVAAHAWLTNSPVPSAPGAMLDTAPLLETSFMTPPPSESTNQLATALEAILSRPTALDEGAVKALIADALRGLDVTPNVTVTLPPLPSVVLEGQTHKAFPSLLRKLHARRHVLLVGDAGTGKTHACEQAAVALSLPLHVQGAVSYAHELLGYRTATGDYVRTPVREAAEHGGLLLLDEFDASSPEAPLVINSLLSNGFIAFPDGLVKKHPDFRCIVAVNTDGSGATMQYSGRARLDGAFLNRFVRLDWEIDPALEKALSCGQGDWLAAVRAVRAYCTTHQIQDVIATPRTTANGAALLAAGEAKLDVATSCLKFGALATQWDNILALPAVAEFIAGF